VSLVKKKLHNILLVDDSRAAHFLMKEAFKEASMDSQLHMVENGDDALSFLRKEGSFAKMPAPDLMLLDLNMPGKTGLDVLDEIKKDESLHNIPVIVLTGSEAAADREACSKFNCKYLNKPTRFHELVELVKSLPDLVLKAKECPGGSFGSSLK